MSEYAKKLLARATQLVENADALRPDDPLREELIRKIEQLNRDITLALE